MPFYGINVPPAVKFLSCRRTILRNVAGERPRAEEKECRSADRLSGRDSCERRPSPGGKAARHAAPAQWAGPFWQTESVRGHMERNGSRSGRERSETIRSHAR